MTEFEKDNQMFEYWKLTKDLRFECLSLAVTAYPDVEADEIIKVAAQFMNFIDDNPKVSRKNQ